MSISPGAGRPPTIVGYRRAPDASDPAPSSHSPWMNTMNRCVAMTTRRTAIAAVALAALTLAPAARAQMPAPRAFPQNALRGDALFGTPPELLLNGRPARLAPGARIHGPDGMLKMSGSLVGLRLPVNYTVESTGLLMDVWVLTDLERARLPWPRTPEQAAAWRFDPAAQAWSLP